MNKKTNIKKNSKVNRIKKIEILKKKISKNITKKLKHLI